jgi:hypothetical protein
MKQTLGLTLFVVAVIASVAYAERPGVSQSPLRSTVTEIDAATTASSRDTGCIEVRGETDLVLDIEVDRDGSPTVTSAAVTCYGHRTATCADAVPKQLPLCIDNTCAAYAPSWAIDADEGWSLDFDVARFWFVKCTVSFTNGDAGDVITVKRITTRE